MEDDAPQLGVYLPGNQYHFLLFVSDHSKPSPTAKNIDFNPDARTLDGRSHTQSPPTLLALDCEVIFSKDAPKYSISNRAQKIVLLLVSNCY